MDAKIVEQRLSDGSLAYAVVFTAKHEDSTDVRVTLAAVSRYGAEQLAAVLNNYGAYAETDVVRA